MFYSSRSILGCAAILSLISSVKAHGVIIKASTSENSWAGNFPIDQDQGTPTASPIWQALSVSPVTSLSNTSLACNTQGGLKPSQMATVEAGSTLSLQVRPPLAPSTRSNIGLSLDPSFIHSGAMALVNQNGRIKSDLSSHIWHPAPLPPAKTIRVHSSFSRLRKRAKYPGIIASGIKPILIMVRHIRYARLIPVSCRSGINLCHFRL